MSHIQGRKIGVVDPQAAKAVIRSSGERFKDGFVAYPVPSPETAAERRSVASTLDSLRSGVDATLGAHWGVAGRIDEGAVAENAENAVTFLRDASGGICKHALPARESSLHVEIDLAAVTEENLSSSTQQGGKLAKKSRGLNLSVVLSNCRPKSRLQIREPRELRRMVGGCSLFLR